MRKSINILVFLLAGCAGKTAPSIAPTTSVPAPPPDREFPVAIHLANHQITTPANPIAPEAVYGLWLREQGSIRTWVRIESPRIHLVLVDKDQGIARAIDGEYTLARDGSAFGVISFMVNFKDKERVDALYRGETPPLVAFMPAPRPEPCIKPFLLTCRVEGGALVLDGDPMFQGRFRKTAETRPTFARPMPPLGAWECQDWENKVRARLHLSDQLEVEMLDQVTGRRVRLAGPYGVTADNLLYGMFTSLDQSDGPGRAPQAIPPQLFCFHYGVAGASRLQIRDLNAGCFDDKAREMLQRDYVKPQDDNQKPDNMQRCGPRH
jgi:hypothetical protein